MKKSLLLLIILSVLLTTCKLLDDEETGGDDNPVGPDPTVTKVTLTSPGDGDTLIAGTSHEITWTSSNFTEYVNLEYTTDNAASWKQIVSGTENTGSYVWNPVPNKISGECRIRIVSSDSLYSDESEGLFNIVKPSSKNIRLVKPNGGEIATVNQVYNITWETLGIENIKIEFSVNKGVSWNTIAASYPADSSVYKWEVPDFPSAECLVKISDLSSSIFDQSDSTFVISIPQELSVTFPNGGEELEGNGSADLKWVSGQVANVKIEYTTNNGLNWTTITESTPSDGFYTWQQIPNTPSTISKIRISDAEDGYPADVSDEFFSITPEAAISVVSPNGGETLISGEEYLIKWSTGVSEGRPSKAGKKGKFGKEERTVNTTESVKDIESVAEVKIEYTTNNGSSWTEITSGTENNGSYKWEKIPQHNSSLCRIRISDTDDGLPSDMSDASFTISNESLNEITVLGPNGGETFISGTKEEIRWQSEGVEAVKIEYTTNNGVNWNTIIGETPSDGNYNWNPVPQAQSANCKIKISDSSDPVISDASDGVFTITVPSEYITITSPNGGEAWEAGTSKNITWQSAGVMYVDIAYSTDNGSNWQQIVTNTESDGFYTWTKVPNSTSTNCIVKITETGGETADLSDATFSILPEPAVTLLAPNGGEVWQGGTAQDIRWNSSNIKKVKLEYTTNNGAEWSVITDSVLSTGEYIWDPVPAINSALCKVRISDANDDLPYDESDGSFRIKNQVTESLTVLSPNGGEVWEAGTNREILWDANAVEFVNIELSTNNGSEWNTIATDVQSTGSYPWNTVPDANSTQCKIRIVDAEDGNPVDESDQLFTIKPVPSLLIVSPNGGEEYVAGEPVNIVWNSSGVENVKIEYTINNGLSELDWVVLVPSTPSDGFYETGFSVPTEEYRVRISEATTGNPVDESNGTFTISPQPSITVIAPNGNEDWLTGTTNEIRWTSTNIERVNIEYTLDGGAEWKEVVNDIPSNGIYNWDVPATIDFRSDLCLVRISDSKDDSPNDKSDNFFTMHPQDKLLRWEFPNGGEYVWKDTLIIWESAGIDFVDIEYTSDNGQTWLPIVNNYQSTGAYYWTIPAGSPSSLSRIRIFDASDHSTTDMSDSHFYLRIMAGINARPPKSGSNGEIEFEWTASPDTGPMDIYYSEDKGETWQRIVSGIPNSGSGINRYRWDKGKKAGKDLIYKISSTKYSDTVTDQVTHK